jgi:hypothetical protein
MNVGMPYMLTKKLCGSSNLPHSGQCAVWILIPVNLEHHIKNSFLLCQHLVADFFDVEKAYDTA